ncbi:MAG: GGDEF domain-containing protein, partial [Gammaproteobacteria bacterium]|nr:GGDEF domain-containing protein [Gammaproteobacteria bacterium]
VTDVAVSRLELESMNGQLRTLSKTDFLTNLNNRGFWEEALINEYKRIKRSGHHSTLLMCDIDHFKRVNDTYGHAAGDAVIQQVAVAVKKNLRSTDVAGRYGGEEFAVLLLDTTVDQAMFFAERLRKNVEAMAVEFNQQVLRVTVSIGLAEFHQEMDEYRDWIEAADKALYQSKAAGRNCITKAEK